MNHEPLFDARPSTIGPFKFGPNLDSSPPVTFEPNAGDSAQLKLKGVTVFARIEAATARTYSATVTGFSDWKLDDVDGLRVGDNVSFTYAQAFGFGR